MVYFKLQYEIKLMTLNFSEGKDPLFVARAMARRGIVLVFNESYSSYSRCVIVS